MAFTAKRVAEATGGKATSCEKRWCLSAKPNGSTEGAALRIRSAVHRRVDKASGSESLIQSSRGRSPAGLADTMAEHGRGIAEIDPEVGTRM
ncbi:hypothetical protein ACA910_003061 [Epithemia clementina (nom. ined.)]